MTPLQRLEIAILTLKAHKENPAINPNVRKSLEAGATEVLVECALAALPSIEIANARNKSRGQEVAA